MPDEDDLAYACDDCGEEFDTQAALDGHLAESCWAAALEEDDDV